MTEVEEVRISLRLKNPNSLFLAWVTKWKEDARKANSPKERSLKIAVEALKRFPLPLETGKDCLILKGFGKKLCKMLDDKLAAYNKNNNIIESLPFIPIGSGMYAILLTLYEQFIKLPNKTGIAKEEICIEGQKYCSRSFSMSDSLSNTNAWFAMRALIDKSLVQEIAPLKYSLTDNGKKIGEHIYNSREINDLFTHDILCNSQNNTNPIEIDNAKTTSKQSQVISPKKKGIPRARTKTTSNNKINASSSQAITMDVDNNENIVVKLPVQSQFTKAFSKKNSKSTSNNKLGSTGSQTSIGSEIFTFAPNSFDIILLVDTQETNGKTCDVNSDPLLSGLNQTSILYEVRHLKVGDYLWVARDRDTKKELVLPYIIERKRIDDFAGSIKDGRFHEQKFRLKQSRIENLIYLIECYKDTSHVGLPEKTLFQAATNTLIQDKFIVKYTFNMNETIRYLYCLGQILTNYYQRKRLSSKRNSVNIENSDSVQLYQFQELQAASAKNKNCTVQEMFIKQLLQIKSLSIEKAIAIASKYATPALLKQEYDNLSAKEGEKLLSNLEFGNYRKKIGPALSKTIHLNFTCATYNG